MKHLLLTTIAAVVLVGCGESQPTEPQTAKAPDISIRDAAKAGNIEAVKQHLAAGVNVKSRSGYTPLHSAAVGGSKEIAELLITEGSDVNAEDSRGSTPLHAAVANRHTEIAELLIANGADVNASVENGKTPLHYAIGREKIAELLMAKGANVNAKNRYGDTPLDQAIKYNHTKTADLLRKHGGKTSEELKAEGK